VHTVAVIPAHNEVETIGRVVDETRRHVEEVVVVDDASTDGTAAAARNHGASVLEHTINAGVGGALRTGYRYAIRNDYEFVIQVDGDGQHDPAYIPDLVDAAADHDMVIGSRYLNESYERYPWIRRLGIRFFTSLINRLGGIEITDVTSGYRVYRVAALERIIHRTDTHWAIEQTLDAAKQNLRMEEVSVEMPVRETGHSHLTPDALFVYPLRMADAILRVMVFR
jgi:glycosyltransferase involved in cell wall biosynthesis